MPHTRGKNGERGYKPRNKDVHSHETRNKNKRALVAKDTDMATNLNTNRSNVSSTKKQKIDLKEYCQRKRGATSDDLNNKHKSEPEMVETETVDFEEEGEIIHMQIYDGGVAVAEFASDYEDEGQIIQILIQTMRQKAQ